MPGTCPFCSKHESIDHPALESAACGDCIKRALELYRSTRLRGPAKKTNSVCSDAEVEEYVIGFGKNKGKRILDVDPGYIRWCLENFDGLRDVDVFQKAFESMTGRRVSEPAALVSRQRQAVPAVSSPEDDGEDFPF